MPRRRLAITPALAPDEWLPTAISRWAWEHFDTTRQALLESMELRAVPPSGLRNLGVEPSKPVLIAISAATGVSTEQLRAATLAPFNGRAIRIDNGRIATNAGWVRRTGTRYCPDCLAEAPGVYQRHWRLVWAFVCLQHNRILEDVCHGCHEAPCDVLGATTGLWDPTTCRNNLADGKPARPCGTRLDRAIEQTPIGLHSPMHAAQERIYRIIAEARHPLDTLRTLAGIISNLRATADLDLISTLAAVPPETLLGLIEPERRTGSAAPHDAYALAALSAGAVHLLDQSEPDVLLLIRRITFSRTPGHVPRGAGHGPGSASELLSYWGHPNPTMQQRILHALEADLPDRTRLRSATNASPTAQPSAPVLAAPGLLWPNWAVPLHIGAGTTMRAMRIAYSRVLSDPRRTFPTRVVALGDEQQRVTTVRALTSLWELTRTLRPPIDYGRRRHLLQASTIISAEHWRALCEAVNADPGGNRRLTLARWHLYLRATGDDVSTIPAWIRGPRRKHDAADLTAFDLRMTEELSNGINAYLAELLHSLVLYDSRPDCSAGYVEPVLWAPPRPRAAASNGPELEDINLGTIHAMLSEGRTSLRAIAQSVHRSLAHVKLAIDFAPPSSGLAASPIAWREELIFDESRAVPSSSGVDGRVTRSVTRTSP